MLISKKVVKSVNRQIGKEFGASLQYVAIANHFAGEGLLELSAFFYKQAEEEREHALKFNKFVLDSGGDVTLSDIPGPQCRFRSALEALQLSLQWENEVTKQISAIYALAAQENDYVTQHFLSWFLKEQLEEVSTMDTLVKVARRAGDNPLLLEEFVARHGERLRAEGGGSE